MRAEAYEGDLVIPESMRSSEITVPGVELHHYITDDQLTELSNMRAEPVMEICLASIGVFFGSVIPAVEQVSRFNSASQSMGIVGLLTICLTACSFAIAIVTGWLWHKRHERHKDLAATIRSRPKVKVRTASNDTAAA